MGRIRDAVLKYKAMMMRFREWDLLKMRRCWDEVAMRLPVHVWMFWLDTRPPGKEILSGLVTLEKSCASPDLVLVHRSC